MVQPLLELFNRDLEKLRKEIELFNDDANLWKNLPGISNSSGTLCLHLAGNLQHFIGQALGNSGYQRDREFEFSGTPVPVSELISEIESTKKVLNNVLPELTEDRLKEPFPIDVLKDNSTVEKFLFHLYGHLNWHLGQVNYLRRVLEPATS